MTSELREWPYRSYAYTLPLRYHLTGQGPGLVVCLHGYQDHASSLLKRLGWLGRTDLPFRVLGINAPFPVPVWGPRGFSEAYAWYFRDATAGFEVIGPEAAARGAAQLMTDLGLVSVPTVILGFSQGAYLAPWLARARESATPNDPTRAIIGVGGGYPRENFGGLAHVPTYAVHGVDDERVPCADAAREHADLVAHGFAGRFVAVPGLRHRVTAEVEAIVRPLIERHLT